MQKLKVKEFDEYKVKTTAFEGPFPLLLTLIEKRKLHISDISLGEITDDYLAHIDISPNFSVSNTSNFILVASTLVLIKSRALLPTLTLTDEEEQSIEDLEMQLKEYKKFKDLSVHIQERFGKNVMFPRNRSKEIVPIFSPTSEITFPTIIETIERVIQALPKIEMIPQVVMKKMVTLGEMTDSLTKRITGALALSFKDFTKNRAEKIEVVIGFLAMLELIKRGIITATQDSHFDDITMETSNVTIPKYD